MAFIVKQKMRGGNIHVFFTVSVREAGKPHPVQQRKYLGVLDAGGNELLLSKSLADLTVAERNSLEAKGIKFVGKRAARRGRLPQENGIAAALSGGRVVEYGRPLLLRELAARLGLLQALEGAFGAGDAAAILCAAVYECCTGEALCRLPEWAEDVVFGLEGHSLSPASISRLCARVGDDGVRRAEFFRRWFVACGKPKSLVSDTTSISSYSERLGCLEWGYNRDLESLPQVNLNL